MNEREFKSLMNRARLLGGDYAAGYQRGLRRHYHGEAFGSAEEHEKFMGFGLNGDYREEMGRGYRDGFAGKAPEPKIGRPELPPEEKTRPRSMRLNDERWDKLQRLGREWLERAIDRAKVPGEDET